MNDLSFTNVSLQRPSRNKALPKRSSPSGTVLFLAFSHCDFCVSPVNKQINDKERVAAAMENPNLREIVEQCVTEPDD